MLSWTLVVIFLRSWVARISLRIAAQTRVLNVERYEVVAIAQEAHRSTKISTALSMEVLDVNVSSADTNVALK